MLPSYSQQQPDASPRPTVKYSNMTSPGGGMLSPTTSTSDPHPQHNIQQQNPMLNARLAVSNAQYSFFG